MYTNLNKIDWETKKNINLNSAYSYCEGIAKQKNPFLYYVSSFFEDKNKFKAFCSTYASMRILDDFVDGIRNRNNLNISEQKHYLDEINKWENLITDCYSGKRFENKILWALSDTFKTFNLPIAPWENLAEAMRWDIKNSRFNTFEDFLNYTEGAAIAPATIFISVLSAQSDSNTYDCSVNVSDPYIYAKDLAIFCYLTHILRDISCDLELENSGLIYLSVEDLKRFSISETDLWDFKINKSVNKNFQEMMKHQIKRARKFGEKGKSITGGFFKYLDSDCKFILELLITLYEKTLDKIEEVAYNVFNGKHELNAFEIFRTTVNNARVHSIGNSKILQFGIGLAQRKYSKFLHSQS
jgi:phytoene synthase